MIIRHTRPTSELSSASAPPHPCPSVPLLRCFLGVIVVVAVSCTTSGEGVSPARTPAAAAKILVSEDGMYEVTAADLQAAGLGWDDVDPMQLRLFYQGRAQPLWIHGRDEKLILRFYGQASESRYARENVYWLQFERGSEGAGELGSGGAEGDGETRRHGNKGVPPFSPSPTPLVSAAPQHTPAFHYTATVRAEENRRYSPQVEDGDHWFWTSLPAPQAQTFDVSLSAVAPGPASIRVEVWGRTEAPVSPDHHLRVTVNGARVADETWDGQGRHTIEADLPTGLLREEVNVVSIEAPGDTGVAADITFVDWIEIRYPRFLVAQADRLTFESGGGAQQLTGFSAPVAIFDVTNPEAVTRLAVVGEQQQEGRTVVAFQGERGRRYLAVGSKGFRRPVRIARASTNPELRAPGNGADYVAIGPPDLLTPLQPLLQWRETQGLKVIAVPVEAVYDQFNYGLPEPEAIRAFMKYAVQAWQPAPHYLLLVGDATYDPRGYLTPPEANRVPSFLIPTVYGGETASDTVFAQLDGDPRPDIAVGRMPARTPQQVRSLVDKILAYERQAAGGAWQRRVLTIADGQDPSFRSDAQVFIKQFPAGFQAVELFPEAGASREVARQLGEGNLLVAYFGHGSVTQWGRDRIFTTADSAELTNGDRLPVVLNMTCLTGLFTHPQVESLAETLLWQAGGGAVAVLAPTSLTLAVDQSFLSRPLAQALLRDRRPTLGEAVLQALRQVPTDSAGTRDVMQTFLLFGDPALRLAYP